MPHQIIDFGRYGKEVDLRFPLGRLAGSALTAAALAAAQANASPSLEAIAQYVNTDGTIKLIVDRNTRRESSTPMPTDGPRTAEGRIITETLTYEYGDCSTIQLVCADLNEFVLAVPQESGDLTRWRVGNWSFRRTACLEFAVKVCVRFIVAVENQAEKREGGFIYSDKHGVEMYFASNLAIGDQRQIFLLTSGFGYLHGGKP